MVAGDVAALDELLHEDLVFGHTNGHTDDKAAYLQKFRAGRVSYHDASHEVGKVAVLGETALVRIHLKMRAELDTGSRQLNVVCLDRLGACAGPLAVAGAPADRRRLLTIRSTERRGTAGDVSGQSPVHRHGRASKARTVAGTPDSNGVAVKAKRRANLLPSTT